MVLLFVDQALIGKSAHIPFFGIERNDKKAVTIFVVTYALV